MAKKNFHEFDFPLKGVSDYFSVEKQSSKTTPKAFNVRGHDPRTGRYRGAQRAGLVKYVDDRTSNNRVQNISHLVVGKLITDAETGATSTADRKQIKEAVSQQLDLHTADVEPNVEKRGFFGSIGSSLVGSDPVRTEMSDAEKLLAGPAEPTERQEKARGLRGNDWWSKVKDKYQSAKRKATRRREYLDVKNNKEDRVVQDMLRINDSMTDFGVELSVREIEAVTSDLTPEEMKVFEKLLLLRDIGMSVSESGEEGLRFGYTLDTHEAELQRVTEGVEQLPSMQPVRDALAKRKIMVENLVKELVDQGLADPSYLDNAEDYFHRQVHTYYEQNKQSGGGRGMEHFTPGFMKSRTREDLRAEEFDFNTNYVESEFEWMAGARRKIQHDKFIKELKQRYDKTGEYREAAAKLNEIAWMGGETKYQKVMDTRAEASVLDELFEKKGISRKDYEKSRKPLTKYIRENDPTQPFRARKAQALQGGNNQASLAIHNEQMAAMKEALGSRFMTPEKLAKKDKNNKEWAPQPGNMFFKTISISEQIAEEILADGSGEIQAGDLRETLGVGSYPTMILPNNIVDQLESMKDVNDSGFWEAVRLVTREWKKNVLLNPVTFTGYNIRNMLGDTEAFFSGLAGEGASKHVLHAERLSRNYNKNRTAFADASLTGGTTSPETKRENKLMEEMVQLGVIGSSRTATEMGHSGRLMRFFDKKGTKAGRTYDAYFDLAGSASEYRENILRIAAYLHYKEALATGKLISYPTLSINLIMRSRNSDGGFFLWDL